jgi:hypothetical protein
MRKIPSLLFVFLLLNLCAFAQELPNLTNIKLNKRASYKHAEPAVEKVVAYLFNTPIDKKNRKRGDAGQFLLNWMNGTPDYTFYLEERESSFFNTDPDLLLMYMAALTRFSLEHPAEKDRRKQALGAMELVLPYLYQQSDKQSWSAALWQLHDAHRNGKLNDFLYR